MARIGKSKSRRSILAQKPPNISTACSDTVSQFHQTHGFYIDGVDEDTAGLPPDWEKRAVVRRADVAGRIVLAVAPCPEDLIVSKLARLDPKDKEFVEAYHAERPLDLNLLEERVRARKFEPQVEERAIAHIRTLGSKP